MADHKKQSTEEIKAELDNISKELDPLPTYKIKEDTEEQEEPEVKTTEEQEESIEEIQEENEYKTKFRESSREALIQQAKNKKINEAIDIADSFPEPTEEDLQKAFSDYEDMTETEKGFARETFINKRFREAILKAREETRNIEVWNDKVEKFLDDPKNLADNPELEGKTEAFKKFASKPTRRGLDFEDLIKAFLYDATKSKVTHKGQMFEKGSSGGTGKDKTDTKLSLEESANLMRTDYKTYKRYLKEGKIKMDIT